MRTRKVSIPPVIGLDLSLTGPAACCIPPGWEVGDWGALKVYGWEPPVPARDDVAALYGRLSWITRQVCEFVVAVPGAPVVAIEGYAFAARSSSVTKLAELGGAVRVALYELGVVPRVVTASQARKLVLGKLPKKDQKTAVQAALWGAGVPKAWSGDVLDALVVANFARSDLGGVALMLAGGIG